MQFFMGQGFNTFRIPFLMERVSPPSTGGLTGPFNNTYLDGLKQTVSYITGKGGFAIIDRECLLQRTPFGEQSANSLYSAQLHDLQRRDHHEHQPVGHIVHSARTLLICIAFRFQACTYPRRCVYSKRLLTDLDDRVAEARC